MIVLDLEQGSDEWLEARLKYFTASEAPIMLGLSPYTSRLELLDYKKTGKQKDHDATTLQIFQRGHDAEDGGRAVLEDIYLDTFDPAVLASDIEGLPLMASLDGWSSDKSCIFEHKLFNKKLDSQVSLNQLDRYYTAQLEQQLLVSGSDKAIFCISNGDKDSFKHMEYTSDPMLRREIIEGWKIFQSDLESHEIEIEQPAPVSSFDSLPNIVAMPSQNTVIHNINDCLTYVEQNATPYGESENDLYYGWHQQAVSEYKKYRVTLSESKEKVLRSFSDINNFISITDELDKTLRAKISEYEKVYKSGKKDKTESIITDRVNALNISDSEKSDLVLEIRDSIKRKRTEKSVNAAIDKTISNFRIMKSVDELVNLNINEKIDSYDIILETEKGQVIQAIRKVQNKSALISDLKSLLEKVNIC